MATIFLSHTAEALKNYYGDRALAGLRALGEVRLNPLGREPDARELIEIARGCELIVSYRGTPGFAELFDASPDLVAFSRCAIDIRNVDVAAASRNGILVTQASAGFVPSVSEWVVGAMVALGRNLAASTEAYHAGRVAPAAMGRQLDGATVGIIGCGQIGRRLAEICVALRMHVQVSDPHAQVANDAVAHVDLAALLAQSDFVVCLAVANESTENLVNAGAFACMKRDAFFINASRGNLVDEAALVRALDSGRLGGCALEVGRAPDQMPTPALAARADVIATPHAAGLTLPAIEHQSMETVAQAAEILKGRAPTGAVNAGYWTRKELLKR